MSGFHNTADYCPTCGQPRERRSTSVERFGIRLLPNGRAEFGGDQIRLSPTEAEYLRLLIERGGASHEMIMLRLDSDADDQITRAYGYRLKKKLLQFTRGAVTVRSVWGWGYELVLTSSTAEAA